MAREKIDPMIFYKNLKESIEVLIVLHRKDGFGVRCILMTDPVYEKCIEALGYEPDNILGYKIELFDPDPGLDSDEQVAIDGYPIN